MENWVLLRKGADFQHISEKFHISPRVASLIRNRDVIGDDAIEKYLNGTIADLYDGMLMKDMDKAVAVLGEKIKENAKIRILMESSRPIFFWRDSGCSELMWTVTFRIV